MTLCSISSLHFSRIVVCCNYKDDLDFFTLQEDFDGLFFNYDF
jgi:hypothetical protein